MRLKVLPALWGLYEKGTLPESTHIVGISRRHWSDAEFRSYLHEVLPQADELLLSRSRFLQGDAEEPATWAALKEALAGDDTLIYLALAPILYPKAFANMRSTGIGARNGRTRVLVEKPFGTSGASARALYEELRSSFDEKDIFLVDHYLAKDWIRELGNLSVPRGEIAWAHIRFFETAGVERRGALYEELGALRDVGQNHMLQILAHLVAPHSRTDALEALALLTPEQVAKQTARAQHEGYRDIQNVSRESQTETYFKIRTTLTNPGFEGVELVLEAGKRLPESRKEVVLELKNGHQMTFSERMNMTDEYELLLSAALRGDQSLSCSMREVEAGWRFIDPILAAWAGGTPELTTYVPGAMP